MLEKVNTMKKQNRLVEVLSNKKVKYGITTALLSGVGVLLPRIFHFLAGSTAGNVLLPMHFAVLIAALTMGIISGSIVAGLSVIFSYLLTGMPSLARLPYMLIELVIYAVLLGIFNKKFNSYISLMATIVLGRVMYAGILFAAINWIGLSTYGISVMQSIKTGLPGIIIQLITVPVISIILNKGLKFKND